MPSRKNGPVRKGTRSCYMTKCGHEQCREAHATYMRDYLARVAAGHSNFVSGDLVRELLEYLRDHRYTMVVIAQRSGYARRYLQRVLRGTKSVPKPTRVHRDLALALIAVGRTPPPTERYMSPVGARRRVRVLECIGLTQGQIAVGCGLSRGYIGRLLCGDVKRISRETHDKIKVFYEANRHLRTPRARASYSSEAELVPAEAWPGNTIDDPRKRPFMAAV